MRALLLALALLGAAPATVAPAWAISDPAEALADPRLEARAMALGREFRCLVCQGESIEDSGAGLARDLRQIVRQRITAGDSNRDIVKWLVARYGNFVRLDPPFLWSTVILWGSPAIALVAGLLTVLLNRRRRPQLVAPLDAAEQARLRDILRT